MDAAELDRKFDDGEEDILEYFDMDTATRPNRPQRVSFDLPEWFVEALDAEALRMGVTRQSIITMWIAERLKRES